MSYLQPRTQKKRFENRAHFSQTQMDNQTQNNSSSTYKRTAITIDSRHRSQTYTPVTTDLLEKNVLSVPKCFLQRSGESLLLKFVYDIDEMTNILDINISLNMPIIIKNIEPNDGKSFHGIPLSTLLFDELTGTPTHIIKDISKITDLQYSVTIQIFSYIYDFDNTVSDSENPITLTLTNIDISRVVSFNQAFMQPNDYMIHLNRTYTNVIAIRLLNTVIPNTAYMINTTTPKNNKLRWINKSSKSVLYSHIPVKNSENPFSIEEDDTITWIEINRKLNNHFIAESTLSTPPIKTYIGEIQYEYSGSDVKKMVNYQVQNTTLLGGQYTAATLSEELESKLNDVADLEKTQSHFGSFESHLGSYSNSESFSDTYQTDFSKNGRFFITTNDNKKFIEFTQCEKVFWNNRKRIYNGSVINESGPCIINEGFGWLYVKHPGHTFVSGDTIRIADSFDIGNIKSNEINSEHKVFVGEVYKVELETGLDTGHVLLFDIIVNKAKLGVHSDELIFGRIVKKWGTNLSDPKIITHLHIELCYHDKGTLEDNLNWYSVHTDTDFRFTTIEKKENAHYGYACKLSTIPNTTFLDGVGNSKLFIGKPIEFTLLMGLSESPKQVLGFDSNQQGKTDVPLEFSTHVSNTIKINEVQIVASYLLPSHVKSSFYNIILQCKTEVDFSNGDYISIENHMVHGKFVHTYHSHQIGISGVDGNGTVVVKNFKKASGGEHFDLPDLPSDKSFISFVPTSSTGFFIHNDKQYTQDGTEIRESGIFDSYYETNELPLQPETYDRVKNARVILGEMDVSSIKVTKDIVTITLSTSTDRYSSHGTFWIYFLNLKKLYDIPSGYYETLADINSEPGIFKIKTNVTVSNLTSTVVVLGELKVRVVTSPYRNCINSTHIVQEILPDEKGKNTRVMISILKNYCNFKQSKIASLPTSLYLSELRKSPVPNLDTTCTKLGMSGDIFMKEIDKPYTLQNNYLYMICPTITSTFQTSSSFEQDNIFAKIMLPGTNGEYVFNTFISYPKVFSTQPLRSLNKLHFKFINEEGELYNFNEMDHSFVLEITELNDRLRYLNVSSGTVQR